MRHIKSFLRRKKDNTLPHNHGHYVGFLTPQPDAEHINKVLDELYADDNEERLGELKDFYHDLVIRENEMRSNYDSKASVHITLVTIVLTFLSGLGSYFIKYLRDDFSTVIRTVPNICLALFATASLTLAFIWLIRSLFSSLRAFRIEPFAWFSDNAIFDTSSKIVYYSLLAKHYWEIYWKNLLANQRKASNIETALRLDSWGIISLIFSLLLGLILYFKN